MRAQSFLLAFLLIVMSFLPLTSASPLTPAEMVHLNRGYCHGVACRLEEGAPMVTFTPTRTRSLASPTSSSPSSPGEHQQVADEELGSVSVLQPSTTSATASPSSSANAGVALASHRTLLCTLLATFLGTVLAL